MTRPVFASLEQLETAREVATRPKRTWRVAIVGSKREVLREFSFQEGSGSDLPLGLQRAAL